MKKFKIYLLVLFLFILPFSLLAGETECPTDSTCIDNPIDATSPEQFIGNVINAVLGISGSLALLMFVYGGFTWMLSGGSPEKVSKGKNTLVWATIGLVVIFSSYALVNFVFTGLSGGSTTTTAATTPPS
ncbi:hypothetical protein C0584_06080 [Candidatus Parcubacteria bacterium]|nr:MAG: hypothetical protein C0584_06080 [Candidatus Parcubacteria bacterium]